MLLNHARRALATASTLAFVALTTAPAYAAGSARLDEALDDHGFAVRVGGGLVEDEALPGDGVLDRFACPDHLDSSRFAALTGGRG